MPRIFFNILPILFFVLNICTEINGKTGTLIGLEYNSEYYWRGMSFYGSTDNSSRGVLFPTVGQSLGDLNFSITGEIPAAYLENQPNNTEKTWIGVDFTADYSRSIIADTLILGGRVGYYMYPQSKKESGYRKDSVKLALSAQLKKILLRPEFSFSYSMRTGRQEEGRENFKDFYMELSFNHEYQLYENVQLTAGGWISYFYYASSKSWIGSEYQGLCDVAAYVELSVRIKNGLSLYGRFSTALVTAPWHDVWGGQDRLHIWATTGISCKF